MLLARFHRTRAYARDKSRPFLLVASTYENLSPRERARARIFPAGASDKPLEYVDLQIKKFTSVSRERACARARAHPFQSSERIKISNIFHGYPARRWRRRRHPRKNLRLFMTWFPCVATFFFGLIEYG